MNWGRCYLVRSQSSFPVRVQKHSMPPDKLLTHAGATLPCMARPAPCWGTEGDGGRQSEVCKVCNLTETMAICGVPRECPADEDNARSSFAPCSSILQRSVPATARANPQLMSRARRHQWPLQTDIVGDLRHVPGDCIDVHGNFVTRRVHCLQNWLDELPPRAAAT